MQAYTHQLQLASQCKHTLTAAVSPLPSLVVVTSRPPAIMVILPLANSMDGAWRASLVTSTSAATRQRAAAPAPSHHSATADNTQTARRCTDGRTEVPAGVTGGQARAAPSVLRSPATSTLLLCIFSKSVRMRVALHKFAVVSCPALQPLLGGWGDGARGAAVRSVRFLAAAARLCDGEDPSLPRHPSGAYKPPQG